MPHDLSLPNEATRQAIAETRAGGGRPHRGLTRDILQEIAKSADEEN